MAGRSTPVGNASRILAYVRLNPGACIQEVADAMGLTRTAARFHLRRLERAAQVEVTYQGRSAYFAAPGVHPTGSAVIRGLLRLPTTRAILFALHADPAVPWRRLARQLGITPPAVRGHVRRLVDAGLIRVESGAQGRHRVQVSALVTAVIDGVPLGRRSSVPP